MPKIFVTAMLCFLCAALSACSDDDGGDTSPDVDASTDVVSDTADSDADAAGSDAHDSNKPDTGEQEGKIAIGEPCPPECGEALNGRPEYRGCDSCANGYCYFPHGVDTEYCTQPCDQQADCDELGANLTCGDGVFELCVLD